MFDLFGKYFLFAKGLGFCLVY